MLKLAQFRLAQPVFLGIFCFVTALILQAWVGNSTVYYKWRYDKHLLLHQAIIENKPAEGKTWNTMGANGVNIRVLLPFSAQFIKDVTGVHLSKIYWWIDLLCLAGAFFCLFFLLVNFVPKAYALIGILYYSIASVCSYHFFYFHPWDRFTQLLWIMVAYFFFKKQDILMTTVIIIMMFAKPDALFFPFLYFAARVNRTNYFTTGLKSCALLVMVWSINLGLGWYRPGGADKPGSVGFDVILAMVEKNINAVIEFGLSYPPMLILLIPVLLSSMFLRQKSRWVLACSIYAVAVLVPYALLANLREVRAFLYVLIFLLPSALISLQRLLDSEEDPKA